MLTEQRAINSKVSADGIGDVGAMAGIAGREVGAWWREVVSGVCEF